MDASKSKEVSAEKALQIIFFPSDLCPHPVWGCRASNNYTVLYFVVFSVVCIHAEGEKFHHEFVVACVDNSFSMLALLPLAHTGNQGPSLLASGII
ncbi:hypothetical protein Anapl_11518 [Anas platyrhynchos]|uniref:Uncharacterized protein n=1 Tax=Anas platyrhynchos TaxID=8839 RepID=R0JUE5_ANAPL|nr:hypothetical protein Anapl_11518 [Anas platyrhynchos]